MIFLYTPYKDSMMTFDSVRQITGQTDALISAKISAESGNYWE